MCCLRCRVSSVVRQQSLASDAGLPGGGTFIWELLQEQQQYSDVACRWCLSDSDPVFVDTAKVMPPAIAP